MKLTIKNFQKKIPVYPKRITNTILNVFSSEGLKKPGEITVCFVSDSKMRDLNRKFLHKDSSTDVLAFDLGEAGEKKKVFADIVISSDTAVRNARVFKTTPLYEVNLYLVHGALHLLGYKDRTAKEKELMRNKEGQYVDTKKRSHSFK